MVAVTTIVLSSLAVFANSATAAPSTLQARQGSFLDFTLYTTPANQPFKCGDNARPQHATAESIGPCHNTTGTFTSLQIDSQQGGRDCAGNATHPLLAKYLLTLVQFVSMTISTAPTTLGSTMT